MPQPTPNLPPFMLFLGLVPAQHGKGAAAAGRALPGSQVLRMWVLEEEVALCDAVHPGGHCGSSSPAKLWAAPSSRADKGAISKQCL